MSTHLRQFQNAVSSRYDRAVEIEWTPKLRGLVRRVNDRIERGGGTLLDFVFWVDSWKPVTLQDWLHPTLILSRGAGYIAEYLEDRKRTEIFNSDPRLREIEAVVIAFFMEFPNMRSEYGGRMLYFVREVVEQEYDLGRSVGELMAALTEFSKRGEIHDPHPSQVFRRRKAASSRGRHSTALSDELKWRVDLLRGEGLGLYLQAQGVGQADDPYRLEKVYEAATGKRFRLGLFQSATVRRMLEREMLLVREVVDV